MKDTIVVSRAPPETTTDKNDNQGLAPSQKMASTPPQQTTSPSAPPGTPSRLRRAAPMSDFCETEDEDGDGHRLVDNSETAAKPTTPAKFAKTAKLTDEINRTGMDPPAKNTGAPPNQ